MLPGLLTAQLVGCAVQVDETWDEARDGANESADGEDADVEGVLQAVAATVTISLDDAYVDSAAANTNFGNAGLLRVDADPSRMHSLLKPRDLGGIARGTRIQSARLSLQVTNGGNAASVHALTAGFSESSVTYATRPARASTTLATLSGSVGRASVDITSLVQGWIDGGTVYGLSLSPTGDDGLQIVSSESSSTAQRPTIAVTFEDSTEPPASNPYCEGGAAGEESTKKETGNLAYNNRSVPFEMRGGVIRTKHSPNACVATSVASGQTQLVALGTSDGGCGSCKVGQPVDRALMENQGFSLVEAVGDEDARSEVWARVFDAAKPNHRSTIAISGDSNGVAWVIANVGTALSTNALANNAVSTGAGKSLSASRLSMSGYQSAGFQFKFLAGFLDDTCSVDEEEEEDHMLSFWGQGDGDTFFVGMWGAGEGAKSGIRMNPLEDPSFDVAIIATGANP